MSTPVYIILGLLITFLAYFLITWGLTSLYYLISKEKLSLLRNLRITALLSFAGFISNIILMIISSSLNIFLFAVVISVVSFAVYYSLLKFFSKFSHFDALIIAFTLAIILNPGWLRLIGIL
jgi:hypothetical protein